MSRLVLLLCLACPAQVRAGQIDSSEVRERDGSFELRVEGVVDADRGAVLAILNDHARWRRLSHVIVQSSVVGSAGPAGVRRRLLLHVCMLSFCFKGPLTEDVETRGPDAIATSVVPEAGAFRSGRGEWDLEALSAGRTRVRLDYRLEPDFWVPPLVGPWLIRWKMLNISREAIRSIEALARSR